MSRNLNVVSIMSEQRENGMEGNQMTPYINQKMVTRSKTKQLQLLTNTQNSIKMTVENKKTLSTQYKQIMIKKRVMTSNKSLSSRQCQFCGFVPQTNDAKRETNDIKRKLLLHQAQQHFRSRVEQVIPSDGGGTMKCPDCDYIPSARPRTSLARVILLRHWVTKHPHLDAWVAQAKVDPIEYEEGSNSDCLVKPEINTERSESSSGHFCELCGFVPSSNDQKRKNNDMKRKVLLHQAQEHFIEKTNEVLQHPEGEIRCPDCLFVPQPQPCVSTTMHILLRHWVSKHPTVSDWVAEVIGVGGHSDDCIPGESGVCTTGESGVSTGHTIKMEVNNPSEQRQNFTSTSLPCVRDTTRKSKISTGFGRDVSQCKETMEGGRMGSVGREDRASGKQSNCGLMSSSPVKLRKALRLWDGTKIH